MPRSLEETMDRDSDVLTTGQGTAAQIAQLFKRDKNTIGRHLSGLTPVGRRRGFPVYDIDEAAAFIVKPSYEIEDRLKRMNQADLPDLLAKEFWNGQRARRNYELENGDLWSTADVVEVLATTFNEARMVLLLMLDRVESETSVTARQREIIKRLTEGGITALKDKLVEAFAGYAPPNDNISGDRPTEDEL